MTIWRMRTAFCIPKATNTHSVCVILIAFQQRLYESASTLHYTHITGPLYSFVALDVGQLSEAK